MTSSKIIPLEVGEIVIYTVTVFLLFVSLNTHTHTHTHTHTVTGEPRGGKERRKEELYIPSKSVK